MRTGPVKTVLLAFAQPIGQNPEIYFLLAGSLKRLTDLPAVPEWVYD